MGSLLQILKIINGVGATIAVVEEMKSNASGGEKSAIVEADVMLALGATELVAQKNIVNEKEFKKHLKNLIKAIVGMLNATVWGKKK